MTTFDLLFDGILLASCFAFSAWATVVLLDCVFPVHPIHREE
jgi:hypothetical protein